jgi:hypothetical protein
MPHTRKSNILLLSSLLLCYSGCSLAYTQFQVLRVIAIVPCFPRESNLISSPLNFFSKRFATTSSQWLPKLHHCTLRFVHFELELLRDEVSDALHHPEEAGSCARCRLSLFSNRECIQRTAGGAEMSPGEMQIDRGLLQDVERETPPRRSDVRLLPGSAPAASAKPFSDTAFRQRASLASTLGHRKNAGLPSAASRYSEPASNG